MPPTFLQTLITMATPSTMELKLQEWESGLFGCFSDCSSCCLGFWCPCILFGQNYEKLGSGSSCGGCCMYFITQLFFLQCIMGTAQRQKIHKDYNREGSCSGACCTYFWCPACANCQNAREIKSAQKEAQFATSTGTVFAAPVEQQMAPAVVAAPAP